MSRVVVILHGPRERESVISLAKRAPAGSIVEFRHAKRSIPQNAKLWSLLGEISRQVVWYGQKLDSTSWKDMFTASLRRYEVVPGIDPGTFVPIGMRTSQLTKQEFSALIELIQCFAAERGVKLGDDPEGKPA